MTTLVQAATSQAARLHAEHLARRRRIEGGRAVSRIPIAEACEAVTAVPVHVVRPEARVLVSCDSARELRPRVTIAAIKRAVCAEFGVSHIDLISPRRLRAVYRPRQVAMLIASRETLSSLCEIGRHLGGRDHTTIRHGILRMEALIAGDAELAARVARCTAMARGETGRGQR